MGWQTWEISLPFAQKGDPGDSSDQMNGSRITDSIDRTKNMDIIKEVILKSI